MEARGRATKREKERSSGEERGREAVAGEIVWLRTTKRIKIKCFCSHFIFLLQTDLALIYW
jgi:hypothetical protein